MAEEEANKPPEVITEEREMMTDMTMQNIHELENRKATLVGTDDSNRGSRQGSTR